MSTTTELATLPGGSNSPLSASTSLADLADIIQREHDSMLGALRNSLANALRMGEALQIAREQLGPDWKEWVEKRTGLSVSTAVSYSRLWVYRSDIDPGLSLSAAIFEVRGKPTAVPYSGGGGWNAHPDIIKSEARKMRSSGMQLKDIAAELGVNYHTVNHWIYPENAKRKEAVQRERKRRRKAAEAALAKQEEAAEMRRRGDHLGKSYALIRQLAKELEYAIDEAQDPEVRSLLKQSVSKATSAEACIVRASKLS